MRDPQFAGENQAMCRLAQYQNIAPHIFSIAFWSVQSHNEFGIMSIAFQGSRRRAGAPKKGR
jgi:hypothetical protein